MYLVFFKVSAYKGVYLGAPDSEASTAQEDRTYSVLFLGSNRGNCSSLKGHAKLSPKKPEGEAGPIMHVTLAE